MLIAKKPENSGIDFDPVPAGTWQAVCYGVFDIGLQKSVFNGEEKIQHKCIVSFEINKIFDTEGQYKGKRFVISKRYTVSLHEKSSLRKDLEAWRGKKFTEQELEGFDIEKLIGANCLLNISHTEKDGKTYSNIMAIMKCQADLKPLIAENKDMPEWIKKLQEKAIPATEQKEDVNKSPEGIFPDVPDDEKLDDGDVPF